MEKRSEVKRSGVNVNWNGNGYNTWQRLTTIYSLLINMFGIKLFQLVWNWLSKIQCLTRYLWFLVLFLDPSLLPSLFRCQSAKYRISFCLSFKSDWVRITKSLMKRLLNTRLVWFKFWQRHREWFKLKFDNFGHTNTENHS